MAQRVITTLTDDIDGGEAHDTVSFAWKGYTYEIDLSAKNLAKFDKAITPYVNAARRVGRAGAGRAATSAPGPSSRIEQAAASATIRAWAIENGYEVTARGRIPHEVREAFETAHA